MVYFDLDGVIRWLTYDLRGGKSPEYWSEPLPNGEDMCKHIDNNLDVLMTSPITPYYDVIKQFKHISILSCQPDLWKPGTAFWIYKHFPKNKVVINFFDSFREKMAFLQEGDFLIEDYPFFEDYSKIVLIDWPYNQNVANPYLRISKPEQLMDFLTQQSLHLGRLCNDYNVIRH